MSADVRASASAVVIGKDDWLHNSCLEAGVYETDADFDQPVEHIPLGSRVPTLNPDRSEYDFSLPEPTKAQNGTGSVFLASPILQDHAVPQKSPELAALSIAYSPQIPPSLADRNLVRTELTGGSSYAAFSVRREDRRSI